MKHKQWFGMLLTAVFLTMLCANNLFASSKNNGLTDLLVQKGVITQEEANQSMEKEKNALETPDLKWYGDLRIRHDAQMRKFEDSDEDYQRNRERFRLRFGMKAKLTDWARLNFRLASGDGYQNTTNQSFDGHSRGKPIIINLAYAEFKPADFFKIYAGKQKNIIRKTSLVWDSDVNPEGLTERLDFGNIYLSLSQWFIEEMDAKEDFDTDPTLYLYQIGGKGELTDNMSMELSAVYYDFMFLDNYEYDVDDIDDKSTFIGYNNKHNQQMVFDENNMLLNKFKCMELSAKLKMKFNIPVSIFAGYIENLDANIKKLIRKGAVNADDIDLYRGDDRDSGFQAGFDIGSKKKKGDLYAKYFYQVLEDYAFPAVFVDSDFHGGGSNNKGHYLQGVYFLADNIHAQGTFFVTEREKERKDGKKNEDRIQLDMILTF